MAIENYREMRDDVRDPKFELHAALSFELERRFPERFIPRYSMVMFHPEISYAEAQRRGAIQLGILQPSALAHCTPAERNSSRSAAAELDAGVRLQDAGLTPSSLPATPYPL